MSNTKKSRLTIYLLKPESESEKLFLTKKINEENIIRRPDDIIIYKLPGREYAPVWQQTFFAGENLDLKQKIAGAIVLVPIKPKLGPERKMLLAFGGASWSIRQGVCEEQFGVRTAINLGDTNKIRSISGKTISSEPKTATEQLANLKDLRFFGIDITKDMMKKITLHSEDERYGKTIVGGRGLSVSMTSDLSKIKADLEDIFEAYQRDAYIKKGYDWIDNVVPIKDKNIIAGLDNILITRINEERSFAGAGVSVFAPEIINWDGFDGFSASGSRRRKTHDEIMFEDFVRSNSDTISVDELRSREVYLWSQDHDKPVAHWRLYNCLSAELSTDDKQYVLSDGRWYEISQNYSREIDAWYKNLKIRKSSLPKYTKTINKKGDLAHSEKDYNQSCQRLGLDVLDRDLTRFGGGLEICDLYRDLEFIHVKIYNGSSAPISHLFAQATASAELFLTEKQYRKEFNEKITHKLPAEELIYPDRRKYKIVLAIITKQKQLALPFFSKINLRSTIKKLEAMGFSTENIIIEKIDGEW